MLGKPLVAEGGTTLCNVLGEKNDKVLAFMLGLVVDLEDGTLLVKLLGMKDGRE